MSISMITRALVLGLVSCAAISTGCSALFQQSHVVVDTWRLDPKTVVEGRYEANGQMNISGGVDWDHRTELMVKTEDGNKIMASFCLVQEGGPGPDGLNPFNDLEVRTDKDRRMVWFVDKNEKHMKCSILLPLRDGHTADEPWPDYGPDKGILLEKITGTEPRQIGTSG